MDYEKLKDFFKNQGISQVEIAKKLGTSKSYVNSILNGRTVIGKKQAETLGKLFGISPAWLLIGEGEMLTEEQHNDIIVEKLQSENISDEILMKLTREDLVLIVKQMMQLHEEQTEMYRILISQNTEMIRNGQKRLEEIMSMLKKTV